ncbi:hypothetical protein Esi_0176_0005 [Ectocarpus siliculosus]|uniref:Uncharacterized protein n=1 Tax=Ectocarpus siliculosus TaxID=2880 RepID=D8LGQ0_ECTSI|nr:hypothetical protein Esi_0176_0005 [Ectocarpus siliculosus]|eukprot:CBN79070.1 hypothetical protein Esi_0176_0005 [Ectocarpus siliculosus]
MPCPMLSRRLADLIHSCTTRGGKRPLAVDILVGASIECRQQGRSSGTRRSPRAAAALLPPPALQLRRKKRRK